MRGRQGHRHGLLGGDQQFVLICREKTRLWIANLESCSSVNVIGAQKEIVIKIDPPDRKLTVNPLLNRAAGGDQQLKAIGRVVVEIEPVTATEFGAQQPQTTPVPPMARCRSIGGDVGDLADLGLNRRQISGAVGIAGHAFRHRDPLAVGEHSLARFSHQPVGGNILFIDVVPTNGVFTDIEETSQNLIGVAIDQRHHAHTAVEQLVGGVALA